MQANAKIERASTKKLNNVISSQKQFSDKSGLGYTEGSSSSGSAVAEPGTFCRGGQAKCNKILKGFLKKKKN